MNPSTNKFLGNSSSRPTSFYNPIYFVWCLFIYLTSKIRQTPEFNIFTQPIDRRPAALQDTTFYRKLVGNWRRAVPPRTTNTRGVVTHVCI